MKFKSITSRIFFLVIPTVVITMLSFVWLSYSVNNTRIDTTVREKMFESLNAADLEIQLELYKNSSIATNFANYVRFMSFDTFDHETHRMFLADNILSNPNTFGGGVWFRPYGFDPDSYYFGPFLYAEDDHEDVVYVPDYGLHVDYFNEDWYIKGEQSDGEIVWSNVYYDPVSTVTMITASMPFYDHDGKFWGVGTADMDLDDIQRIVDTISADNSGKAFILGAQGEYISFFDGTRNATQNIQTDPDPNLAALGQVLVPNQTGTTSFVYEGKTLRVYYMTMQNTRWTLCIAYDESDISSSALNEFIISTIIPMAGLLLVILGIFIAIRYLRRIVNKVNTFADLAASGDLSKRIDVTEADEFGFMEQRLNIMISNMNDMQQRSDELLQVAENASRSKSEFLSRMSHEIRTPMNAIIGMTLIAKTSDNLLKVQDCIHKIENASKHLLALINDVLDMSRIEANKMELAQEEFSLEQTLANIYGMMLVKAEEKQQRFTLNVDENVPVFIISDELRLSQVITNLVSNASKFTPDNGLISLDVKETQREGQTSTLQVSVTDSGIGMTESQQNKLFQSFEQADSSISRKFGGTGLGLAISKRIVELMGGTIYVSSKPNEGSTFAFTISVQMGTGDRSAQAAAEAYSQEELSDLRILVVDDSREAVEYLKYVLNNLELDCDCVYDGYEALRVVEQAMKQGRPYDVIFMDYMMPRLNGVEAAKRIRQIARESTSIIMVSIYDWDTIKLDAQNAGVRKYITKPVSPSSIMNSLQETLGSRREKPPKLPQSDFNGCTILLVDDVDINREIVSSFLENSNVVIEAVQNGAEAVERFTAEPERYNLILMDIQMPVMDGYEATRQIRQMDLRKAKTIPIIAMTANAMSEDVRMCKAAGMNDHLAKPIEPDLLLHKLNDYLFMRNFLDHDIS